MATLDRDPTNENPADVDPAVSDPADAFCRLRLEPRGSAYGAHEAAIDAPAIIERAMPAA